ncbi:MAG: hypothetical protein QXP31_04025 [Pyrobaculum sp.]
MKFKTLGAANLKVVAAVVAALVASITIMMALQQYTQAPPMRVAKDENATGSVGDVEQILVISAEFSKESRQLTLLVKNRGVVDVAIAYVKVGETECGDVSTGLIPAGVEARVVAVCPHVVAERGTIIPGVLVTARGTSFPFTTVVK